MRMVKRKTVSATERKSTGVLPNAGSPIPGGVGSALSMQMARTEPPVLDGMRGAIAARFSDSRCEFALHCRSGLLGQVVHIGLGERGGPAACLDERQLAGHALADLPGVSELGRRL